MSSPCPCRGCTLAYKDGYEKGYLEGYNAHARSRAYAEAVYGPYPQHGAGQNP